MKNWKLKMLPLAVIALMGCSESEEVEIRSTSNINDIHFSLVMEFDENQLEGINLGMASDPENNTLFVASRKDYPLTLSANRETLLAIDLNSNTVLETEFQQSDFITKEVEVTSENVLVFGGQYVNFYNKGSVGDPTSVTHGKILTNFNTATYGDGILIIGGDFFEVESDKVFFWEAAVPEQFSEMAQLPQDRYGADGEVIGETLYVVGGTSDKTQNLASNTIFEVSLSDGQTSNQYTMPFEVEDTFIDKYEEYIIAAGLLKTTNEAEETFGKTSFLGFFNTQDKQFYAFEMNDLQDDFGDGAIGNIAMIQNTLYMLYGKIEFNEAMEPVAKWSLLKADLQ